jgi:hypothetical protein
MTFSERASSMARTRALGGPYVGINVAAWDSPDDLTVAHRPIFIRTMVTPSPRRLQRRRTNAGTT